MNRAVAVVGLEEIDYEHYHEHERKEVCALREVANSGPTLAQGRQQFSQSADRLAEGPSKDEA